MWVARVALQRPDSFVVLALPIAIFGVLTTLKKPTDIRRRHSAKRRARCGAPRDRVAHAPIGGQYWSDARVRRRLDGAARTGRQAPVCAVSRAISPPGLGRVKWLTRRPDPPIAPPALSGASSGKTKGSALGMRRRHRYARKKRPTGRKRAVGNGAAKVSTPKRCRSRRTAQIAFIGSIPRAASVRSTVAICPWHGGRTLESARVTRLIRFRSPGRERSGVRRTTRISARRDFRAAQASRRRPCTPRGGTRFASQAV